MPSGKALIALGVLLIVAGLMLELRLRLPGDFVWRGKNWTVAFPLGTSILLSVVLSLLLWLFNRKP